MKEDKKTEIRVGLTVFIALLLFAIIYGWAKNFSIDSNHKNMKINFPTVAGLEIGDLVSVNGVRKGLIESINSGQNSALVELRFNEPVDLREDATFSIMMLDLMGGKKIEISSGFSSQKLDFSKVQTGNFSGDISTAMAALSSVEGDIFELINQLKTSLTYINDLFSDDHFSDNIKSSVSNLEKLSSNLNNLLDQNSGSINSSIANFNELTETTNSIITENRDNIKSTFSNLDTTFVTTQKLLNKLNKLTNQVINKENNIGKLIYDDQLISDLQESIKQIKELTTTINKQLKEGGLEVKADVDLF